MLERDPETSNFLGNELDKAKLEIVSYWKDKYENTQKALDIAVDVLKELRPTEKKGCYLVPTVFTTQRIIDEALEQITALEQKE